jgi:hypothetical protein
MSKLSYNSRRAFVGLTMIPVLLCLVNYYADLNWFGKYGAEVLAASFVLLFIAIAYIGPTIGEMEERGTTNRRGKSE